MSFFNHHQPILRWKQQAVDIQDHQGLLVFQLSRQNQTLVSTIYTRVDQSFGVWGLLSALIFMTAQFTTISWTVQAICWSALTLTGVIAMFSLTHFWVKVERVNWILSWWSGLMLLGVMLTDLGIFGGWGQILMHLCHLWLGLSAVGYLVTGLGLRSRALLITATIHLLGLVALPYFIGWQFFLTGAVMTTNLLFLAQVQWDMRPPLGNYNLLSEEQKQFNQQQHQLRHSSY